jgi:hypothetical protein
MGILFQIPNYLTAGYMCRACHAFHGGSAVERWGVYERRLLHRLPFRRRRARELIVLIPPSFNAPQE